MKYYLQKKKKHKTFSSIKVSNIIIVGYPESLINLKPSENGDY